MSNIQLYIIIVRCEQRDDPPRPSAHHVTGKLKKRIWVQKVSCHIITLSTTKMAQLTLLFGNVPFDISVKCRRESACAIHTG